MSDIFREGLNFENIIKDVARRGWSFEIEGLNERFNRRLARSVESGPFRLCPESSGAVRQEFEGFSPQRGEYPIVDQLGDKLGQMVRWNCGSTKALRDLQFNDVSVQRYSTSTAGITKHRDYKRDLGLVVAATAMGYAKVGIYDKLTDDQPCVVLETGPGSLLFLAGFGLNEFEDSRKGHEVGAPIGGTRISVGYRQTIQS